MTSASSTKHAPPPPPPPKPKPKPPEHTSHTTGASHAAASHASTSHASHAAEHSAPAKAAVAKKASAEVQSAARRKFQHAAPTPAQAKKESARSVDAINKAAKALPAARDDDAKRAAELRATHTVARELSNKTPEERADILSKTHHAMGAIGAGLDKLTGDQTTRAISDLTSAAEAAGPKLARHITDPIAHALPTELQGDGDNSGELVDGIKYAVANGKGAVFATSLAQSAREVPALQSSGVSQGLDQTAADAIKDTQSTFADAQKKAQLADARLALTVTQWKQSGTLSPGAIQAGIDAYKTAHNDTYVAADHAATALANALPGAAAAARDAGPLGDASRDALKQVPAIAQRDAGARVLAGAIERNSPYLDESKHLLKQEPDAKTQMEGFDNAILHSVAVAGPDLVKHGERDRVSALVAGASRVVDERKLKQSLAQYHDKIDALPPDLTGVSLGRQLASTASTIAQATLGTNGAASGTSAAPRFAALGAALGLGALAQDAVTLDPHDVKSVLGAAGDATSTGISFAQLAGANLGRASLVVGAAFATFQTGVSLAQGDVAGAAAASLPLVGLGVGAVVGGPVGAGIGLAVGGLAETAISLFGSSGPTPDQIQEEASDPFLQAAFAHDKIPNAETAAYRLRDVYTDGNTFTGVGDSLAKIARARGQTPHQLLNTLAQMPSNNLKIATTKILDARKTSDKGDDADVVALIGQLQQMGDEELPDWAA